MKKVFIVNITLIIFIISSPFINSEVGASFFSDEPTATVIDDETGKPIEGAVAISIWRKAVYTWTFWISGVNEVPSKIEESVSDKNGNIFIPGYWNWHLFEYKYPRLDVYKFGYICWDQYAIFIYNGKNELRKDFDKKHRIIRLKKWPEGFSYETHYSFVSGVTSDESYRADKKLFLNEFKKESPYQIKEKHERWQKEEIK
jgi:hypothetical protein